MKTLVVGHVTHDYYGSEVVAGGCAYYGALTHCALAGPDEQVHLMAVVGDDFRCAGAIAGVDHTLCVAGKTTVFSNEYPEGKPRVQWLQALAGAVEPQMVAAKWLGADLVHLAPVLGEVDLQAWKQAVRAQAPGTLLAINIQGWIKCAGPSAPSALAGARRVVQRFWQVSADDFRGVDIACLSEEDVLDQPGLLEKLVEAVPVVAFTRGQQGSRIFVRGAAYEVGVYPTPARDPTGAGDVFAASFAHRIARGDAPVQAARFAAAAASIVVEDIGARALGRLGEARGRVAAVPVL